MRLPISDAITTFSDLKSNQQLHTCDFLKTAKKSDAIFAKCLMTKRGSIGGLRWEIVTMMEKMILRALLFRK